MTTETQTESKTFPLGTVLTVATGLTLPPLETLQELLQYLTGMPVFTHQIGRVAREVRPHLLLQLPQLASEDLQFEVLKLQAMLAECEGADRKYLVMGWLIQQTLTYGENLPVQPLPAGTWSAGNPIEELTERVGADRLLVFVTDDDEKENAATS